MIFLYVTIEKFWHVFSGHGVDDRDIRVSNQLEGLRCLA